MKLWGKTNVRSFIWAPTWWTLAKRQSIEFSMMIQIWKKCVQKCFRKTSGIKGQPEEFFLWYYETAHRKSTLVHKCPYMGWKITTLFAINHIFHHKSHNLIATPRWFYFLDSQRFSFFLLAPDEDILTNYFWGKEYNFF